MHLHSHDQTKCLKHLIHNCKLKFSEFLKYHIHYKLLIIALMAYVGQRPSLAYGLFQPIACFRLRPVSTNGVFHPMTYFSQQACSHTNNKQDPPI